VKDVGEAFPKGRMKWECGGWEKIMNYELKDFNI
jgi:hypothetical protein